jgi:hypothetical protein
MPVYIIIVRKPGKPWRTWRNTYRRKDAADARIAECRAKGIECFVMPCNPDIETLI